MKVFLLFRKRWLEQAKSLLTGQKEKEEIEQMKTSRRNTQKVVTRLHALVVEQGRAEFAFTELL